jgi:hypothetical protein
MSAETYEALSAAVSAHVGDEMGDDISIVKDWVTVASVSDMWASDGREQIVLHRSEGTALYAVSGLLQWGATIMTADDPME